MTLESMKRRIEEVESGIEPDTVQVRLSTGEEREYSQAEVRQALNDALSGDDTPLLQGISAVTAYRNDESGLAPWIQLATVIRVSQQRLSKMKDVEEQNEDATAD